jgi:hypothetical protein
MPITLSGDGSISGLTVGAGIAANVLSGQVPDANAPSGSVIQVVTGTTSTQVDTSGTSYVDSGLSASITPRSSSSKILVLVSQVFGVRRNDPYHAAKLAIVRNTTVLHYVVADTELNATRNEFHASPSALSVLDSPATTSSVTYKTQLACWHGVSSEQAIVNTRSSTATIILMEIAA